MRAAHFKLPVALFQGCLLAGLIAVNPVAADEEDDARQQLETLKADMAALGTELKQEQQQRSSLQQALGQSEIAIGTIQTSIKQTRKELRQVDSQLQNLHAQKQELLIAKGQQQASITRELQTAYQMGRQSQMKILLNQEEPGALARSMAYYEYFYEARKSHIKSYLDILEQIESLQPDIESTAAQLQVTQTTLNQQRQQLEAGKKERQQLLARLNTRIASKDQRLQQMSADREELEQLLLAIEEAVASIVAPATYQNFSELKGGMPWPVEGKPGNRYGSKRSGSLNWQGLSIPAREGTTVAAIHHGRVVFADWFRGSGLLLIIDHGDGYMSLYAHNQALLREVGEWVNTGAPITTVGNSGGQSQAALYFEIRENGKPTNPGSWLSRG